MKPRVGILISGRGSNMAAIIAAAQDPSYPASVACVIANRADAKGLATAAAHGIPALCVDHKAYPSREAFEDELDRHLREQAVDLVVLAGFMRVLTVNFISRWQGRLINIHPSLLPAYRGLHTHERALADGVRLHGCTVHFVVPELDAGPIIAQGAVPVRQDDTADSLAARVLGVENALYPRVLAEIAAGRVKLKSGRVLVSSPAPDGHLVSMA